MTRPPLSVRGVQTEMVQFAACAGLEGVHDQFGTNVRACDHMNVVHSDVSRKKVPIAEISDLPYPFKNRFPSGVIEGIRRLVHLLPLQVRPGRTHISQKASVDIVVSVHRT